MSAFQGTLSRKTLLVAGAGLLAIGLCSCMLLAGGLVGWWAMKPAAKGPEAVNGVTKAGGGAEAAPANQADRWSFQDLQDYLAGKGMNTSRGAGRRLDVVGMWYLPGDGTPIDALGQSSIAENLSWANMQDAFLAEPRLSGDDARKQVIVIRDVQQREALACGKYVLHGSPERLAELKKLLP